MDEMAFLTGKWCTVCKILKPVVQKICDEHKITLRVLDIEENEKECANYVFSSLPTIFYGNKSLSGSFTRQAVEAMIMSKM